MNVLLVALGGATGAVARFLLDGWVKGRLGTGFPWGTFLINVSGALFIGVVAGLISTAVLPVQARPLLVVGLLGGYTTFSTYSQDTLQLLTDGNVAAALLYSLGQVVLGLAFVYIGLRLTGGL